MSAPSRPCPHCQTPMTPGAVRTTTRDTYSHSPFVGNIKGSNRVRFVGADGRQYRVHAYRCDHCGLVELAATEPVAPPKRGCLGVVLLAGAVGVATAAAVGLLVWG